MLDYMMVDAYCIKCGDEYKRDLRLGGLGLCEFCSDQVRRIAVAADREILHPEVALERLEEYALMFTVKVAECDSCRKSRLVFWMGDAFTGGAVLALCYGCGGRPCNCSD